MEMSVRKFGFALLIVGMLWLIGIQLVVNLRGGIRPVLQAQYDLLEATPKAVYSKQEVEAYVRNTANAVFDEQPLFIFPGVVLFAGGLLASRPARTKSAGSA